MTQLANRKTRMRFETSDTVRGRAVMIEADAYTLRARLKGTRTSYEMSWAGVFWQAVKVATAKAQAERKAAKRRILP